MGFRRFFESEFSADLPPTLLRCERYLAGPSSAEPRSGRCSACAACSRASRSCRRRLLSPAASLTQRIRMHAMTKKFDAARCSCLIAVALVATVLAALCCWSRDASLASRPRFASMRLRSRRCHRTSRCSRRRGARLGAGVRFACGVRAQLEQALAASMPAAASSTLGTEPGWPVFWSRPRRARRPPGCARRAARLGRRARDHAATARRRGQRAAGGGQASPPTSDATGALRAARPCRRAGPVGTRGRHGPVEAATRRLSTAWPTWTKSSPA